MKNDQRKILPTSSLLCTTMHKRNEAPPRAPRKAYAVKKPASGKGKLNIGMCDRQPRAHASDRVQQARSHNHEHSVPACPARGISVFKATLLRNRSS